MTDIERPNADPGIVVLKPRTPGPSTAFVSDLETVRRLEDYHRRRNELGLRKLRTARFIGGPLDGTVATLVEPQYVREPGEDWLAFAVFSPPLPEWVGRVHWWEPPDADHASIVFQRGTDHAAPSITELTTYPRSPCYRLKVQDYITSGRLHYYYDGEVIVGTVPPLLHIRVESIFGVTPAPGVITDVAELAQRELPHTCCFDCGSQVPIAEVWTKKADPNYALCEGCFRRAETGGRAKIAKET